MILAFDLGNTHLHAALMANHRVQASFTHENKLTVTEAEIQQAIQKLISVGFNSKITIDGIACSSVSSQLYKKVQAVCLKLFNLPIFILNAQTVSKLEIRYENPEQLGSDRIAAAVAAINIFPNRNIMIFDLGTATTTAVINKKSEFLGGWITPGLVTAAQALNQKTARLPFVEVRTEKVGLGRNTDMAICSGLFLQTLFYMRGLIELVQRQNFSNESMLVIGTGGLSKLYQNEGLFNDRIPDLVLNGLSYAFYDQQLNNGENYATYFNANENSSRHSDGRRPELRRIDFDRSEAV